MARDAIQIEQPATHGGGGAGIFKRLVSRVRTNSAEGRSRSDSVNSNSSSNGTTTVSSNGHNSPPNGAPTLAPAERSRTRTPSFKTPSFKIGVNPSNNSSGASQSASPFGKKGSVSSVTSTRSHHHPEAPLSRELWDEAYDNLRLDPSTSNLVVTYEAIVSQELPNDLKLAAHAILSPPASDGGANRRMDLMQAIANRGLNKRRGSKTSQVDDSAHYVLEHTKRTVEDILDDFPSAALSWSGFLTLTPLLMDPILRHGEFRRGMLHITGRIPWYMHLTHLLHAPSWHDADDFEARQQEIKYRRERARDATVRLYRKVLEFEMNCVCATASAWNSVAKHTVRWNTLGKLNDDIEAADERVTEMIKECVVESSARNKMLARNVDLDLQALEKKKSREEEDLRIDEKRDEE